MHATGSSTIAVSGRNVKVPNQPTATTTTGSHPPTDLLADRGAHLIFHDQPFVCKLLYYYRLMGCNTKPNLSLTYLFMSTSQLSVNL